MKYKLGAVHGRFQPIHLGHMRYILKAKEECDFLWVGITQFNISSLIETPNDPHRQIPINNPLTYFERVELITISLCEAGLSKKEFSCIPFPIETPQYLYNFLPTSIPMFTTICDEWNQRKIEILKQYGYQVEVLYTISGKQYEGTDIRKKILLQDETWKSMVPEKTIVLLQQYNLQQRLERLI